MKKFCFLFFVFIFSACSLGQKELSSPPLQFVLIPKDLNFNTQAKTNLTIKILMPQSPLYLQLNRIFYLKNNVLNSYNLYIWENSLATSYYQFAVHKVQNSGIFAGVINTNSFANADFVLESRLDTFEQVLKEDENFIHLKMSVNLIKKSDKNLIAQKYFEYKIPVKNQNIESVVASFNETLNIFCDEMVMWLDEVLK